jgi:glucose-1-phosphate thymidylyltransferase
MKQKGTKFVPGKVNEWLDCGNYKATVYTNQRVLEHIKNENIIDGSLKNEKSKIIEPCFIGKNVVLKNATVGPHVSIGDNSTIENSTISNTIVQTNTTIINSTLTNSMIGNFVKISNNSQELSIGDYNEIN